MLKNLCCLQLAALALASQSCAAFVVPVPAIATARAGFELQMGLFDNWSAAGSGKSRLDEEWEKQQEILKARRAPKNERDKYFMKVSYYY